MVFTEKEKKTVMAVFSSLVMSHNSTELNTFLGSETIKELYALYEKMKYEPYCERHGIRFEDMDEFDYEMAYREEWET